MFKTKQLNITMFKTKLEIINVNKLLKFQHYFHN